MIGFVRAPDSGRVRLLALIGAAAMLAWTLTRIVLACTAGVAARLPEILVDGFLADLAVTSIALAPLAWSVSLGDGRWLRHRAFRFAFVSVLVAAIAFMQFVEFFFFEEFEARLNHIALDYVLFPGEVAGNIWQSYPIPIYGSLALLAGLACAAVCDRLCDAAAFPRLSWSARITRVFLATVVAWTALDGLSSSRPRGFGDRRVDEIASNGLLQLARAYESASLDYSSYYLTADEAGVERATRSELGWRTRDDPQRIFEAAERRTRPLDIVVVLSESFGSEFVGRLGGRKPNAPGLERWAERGLLLTNVVATGNRTVRGLEGVLCSFVPLPGDSIWKRDQSHEVATIAGVLREHGYRTEFVYGGDGSFDRMKSFALRNGWQSFHEDSLIGPSSYPSEAFRTVWGVADETMFSLLLERQRAAARDGARFFGTALTVSNHKPFLTPSSAKFELRGAALRQAGITAAVLAALTVLAWRMLARWPRGPQIAALVLLWTGLGVHAWSEAQPRDSRAAAVRYADLAFADYMDRAKAEGLLDHTVVLFVGDHGARVYGSEEIPAASYRVPALFVAPDSKYAGTTIPRLCSQIDLAPTLLSIAGVDFMAPFFGQDLLKQAVDGPGRAYLIHNRSIGLLTDTSLIVLGLRKSTSCYRREGRASDSFVRVGTNCGGQQAERAAAVYQLASQLYESRRYRLRDEL